MFFLKPSREPPLLPVSVASRSLSSASGEAGGAAFSGRITGQQFSVLCCHLQPSVQGWRRKDKDAWKLGQAGCRPERLSLSALTPSLLHSLQVASIGARGAQALGDALAVNRTLEILE